jgi:carbamoyl-phosphate synthase large subunit
MKILITSIGRRGYIAEYFRENNPDIQIFGTSNTSLTPAFRYCEKIFIVPNILNVSYVDEILKICKEEKIDVILSLFDLDISVLSARRQDFIDLGIKTFLTFGESSDIAFDKYLTYLFCLKSMDLIFFCW